MLRVKDIHFKVDSQDGVNTLIAEHKLIKAKVINDIDIFSQPYRDGKDLLTLEMLQEHYFPIPLIIEHLKLYLAEEVPHVFEKREIQDIFENLNDIMYPVKKQRANNDFAE